MVQPSSVVEGEALTTDQMVKCWDLEANKVIRHYHGHLSGVYSLSLHPTLDVLVTAGRDATARVSFVDRIRHSAHGLHINQHRNCRSGICGQNPISSHWQDTPPL